MTKLFSYEKMNIWQDYFQMRKRLYVNITSNEKMNIWAQAGGGSWIGEALWNTK